MTANSFTVASYTTGNDKTGRVPEILVRKEGVFETIIPKRRNTTVSTNREIEIRHSQTFEDIHIS